MDGRVTPPEPQAVAVQPVSVEQAASALVVEQPIIPLHPVQRDTLLLELRDGVVRVEAALAVRGETVADHEARIRYLERWRYGIPGALMFAVMALASTLIAHLH